MIIEKLRNLRGQSIAVRSIVPRWGLATEPPVKLFNREIKGEEELLEPEWKIFISPSFFAKPRRWPISHTRSQTETCSIRHHCSPIDASHTAYVPNISCWWLYLFAFLILHRSAPPTPLPADGISAGERDLCVEHTHTHTFFMDLPHSLHTRSPTNDTHKPRKYENVRSEFPSFRFTRTDSSRKYWDNKSWSGRRRRKNFVMLLVALLSKIPLSESPAGQFFFFLCFGFDSLLMTSFVRSET